MKKLSLKNLKLQSKDFLERNQLKTVLGGNGGYGGGGEGNAIFECMNSYNEFFATVSLPISCLGADPKEICHSAGYTEATSWSICHY